MPTRIVLLVVLAIAALLAPATVSAQEATPSAPAGEVQQFADDTYAFVSGGYVSLFIVTDEGVIATDPGSLVDPEPRRGLRGGHRLRHRPAGRAI